LLVEVMKEDQLLPVRQAVHRLSAWPVHHLTFGKRDAATPEEVPDAVEARLSVEVAQVIGSRIEASEVPSGPFDARVDEGVERLRPRGRMELCTGDQDAVEVEDACPHRRGQAENAPQSRA
jgi:hypothetical protein